MIAQPEYVTRSLFETALVETEKKKGVPLAGLMRCEPFQEGRAAQIMHIGPFSEEGPTISKIHDTIETLGAAPLGKHHEIYLSDFRKTSPDKLRTVLRQPFAAKT